MRSLLSLCLAATPLVAQASSAAEPHLAGVLEPLTAAQLLLPVRGFPLSQLAYGPLPHPALRAGATSFYVPDPLLCSANYVGAEVVQLVFALPQGVIVLLDASSSLALHVLPVPPMTWSALAGVCIDGEHEQVVLLDAAEPRLLRIDFADLRAGKPQFQATRLPFEWSTVRAIAFDFARDRIVGFNPETGALLQHSATDPNPSAGTLSPAPGVLAFGFAPTESLDHELFVSCGGPRMLTSQYSWSDAGPDGTETATLRATVATSAWSPASPDPSGIGFDSIRDRLMVSDGEVEEMTIYAGKNVWEATRAGVVSRSTTTVGYSNEPVGITFQSATRTFYISDDTTPDAVYVLTVGPDGLLHTSDDTRRSFDVGNFPTDPEDTAFDNARNELWVAGGIFNTVHRLRPGPNGIFNGIPSVGDDQILTINVSPFGVTDVEAIAVRPADGGIYVVGQPITTLLHLNNAGQFVRTITLPSTGLVKPAGIVFAPASSGTGDSMYLVDRGIDNEFFPNENDGMLFEYGVPLQGANQAPVVNAGPDVTVLVTAAATLAGTATDDGLPSPLTIQWSQFSGPGTTSFAAPNQAATTATFSAAGSYTLRLSANDGEFTTTDTCVVTVQPSGGGGGGGTVERVIAAGADDAEQGTTSVGLTSGDIELVVDGAVNQVVGLRFLNLAIPAGHVVTSAFVQFTTDEVKTDPTQLTIAGQASDNAPTFVSAANDISSRPRTTATVAWAPAAWTTVNEAGANQRTPNLASIVQEIMSRPGWISGNAIVLVITGTGTRTAVAYESNPAAAARLIVNHAPGNQAPVVNAGPDVTTQLSASASLAGTVTDDGLPGPVTIQWSKLSGPGTVTFAAPSHAATTATFSASGSYTLQLSANDGEFTRTDTCVVTVQQANQAPVVNAGPDVTILVTGSANLQGTVSDDGLPGGPLTIQWSKVSGPGTVSFAASSQAATTATFSAAGSYVLQLSAFDGQLTSTDTCAVTVQTTGGGGGTSVERTIATSDDDAEESSAGVNRSSGDLELVVDGSANQVVGLRFTNLTIPAGATIASAFVQFTTDEVKTDPTQLTIAGEASDNAATFTGTASNISSRSRTTATVAWAPVPWTTVNEAGANQRTPNLASIVQQIVNRPGWASGNAMVLVITGTGTRTAVSFDGSATSAAKLTVNWQSGAPANQPPVVNAGPDVTTPISTPAHLVGTVTDDGLPGPLTIQWTKVSGPGTATFAPANQAVTDVTFSQAGSYTLQLSASDGQLTSTDTCAVTVQTTGGGGSSTVERVVAASTDDAEEAGSSVNRSSGDIELVTDGSQNQVVGLRFQNLTIPAGATIASAFVQFTTDEVKTDPTQLTIAGEASDNAATFTGTASNISSRSRTTATVAWAPVAWTTVGEAGPNQRTPNLASIVQQVVSRPGWASGNALAFVITGTGTRTAVAFDGGATQAAKLIVSYQSGAPANQPPVVNAGPDVTTPITSAAHLVGTVTDDGLPGPLTIQWTKVSGPGTATFAPANQAVTDVTFSQAGSYTLQLSANDGEFTVNDTVAVTVTSGSGSNSVERFIAASDDDAEESSAGVSRGSSDLELVVDGSTNQVVGLRFTNLTIPAGATITSAFVQFTTDEVKTEPTQLTIAGQAADNAPTFTGTALNVSSRPRTTATVAWAPAAWNIVHEAGLNQRTSNLGSIVQEIVSRPGWASGNAIVLVITGTGTRTASAFDDSAAFAPKLVVNYQ